MGNSSSSSAVPENSVLDVELEIVLAKDIAAGDFFDMKAALKGKVSSSDAYALIEVAGQKVAWTRPIFDTLEPVWNEKFFFKNVKPDTICKLYLFDEDFNGDDALGQTQFTAANTDGAETTFELPIKRNDKAAGTIVVKVKSRATKAHGDGQLHQYGPVHYSAHLSVSSGILSQSLTEDEKLECSAYHVHLHNIPQILRNDHEWNKNYPTIQKIFSPDHPESPVLRKAIATEHEVVYRHAGTTEYGQLKEPSDLFKLVNYGRRQDKPVLFTYAITSTGWYFSETGAAFFKDMLSKHMLHSGAAFSVKYAGEFHIQQADDDTFKLVIDNNSGTYAPPQEQLPQLQELMENNFPGIICEALDRDDETLMEARKEIFAAWE
ncbi:C2 domain-containing protein, putative [Phytophthora infestans T30-4]|uniref:C2 domain-containing protein, putative n=1 Tax=Phytophthora infestans (strain T30-4) TaxID=403677 RepID=D0NHE3_PHYIT|nr:C2 domain-containing protein, putative [Phytophthora infestans T30-4]EEY58868.1 C2 domain-containing protein, putative [Phytophthora infestans T30-4]|eukprot:XP_002901341.1 C2 domain-containing protein, putative [Phytophthora infestans T30-4]